ncbi:ATP-binding protein [Agrobacterium sp. rho-13.3]|uniref:ATP-binding protein n=1 Tax=Agrobacterium sp. rho-13.3 TaxID=3072980 RepID=UPI002A0FC50C|nr:ATP-binding protein [Agrobacterium sp. rho-13.3]MDX8306194.1 ATP-binding protein [Agrobacterium sp. rho-13.3]MDX8307475.1 ATP-binding protein [Agrobacterium sp. rho-13.3]
MTNFNGMSIEDRKLHIEQQYILQPKDKELESLMATFTENAERALKGGGSKMPILFVIGESNTGKSHSLKRLFSTMEAFQPREDASGAVEKRLLSMDCESDCSPKALAEAILDKWNITVSGRTNAPGLWGMVKRQLRHQKILFLHLDEMQHVTIGDTDLAIRKVQNAVKSLTQIEGWPLHLIVSGMPDVVKFMESKEVKNRAQAQYLDLMDVRASTVSAMEKVVSMIVCDHAGLRCEWSKKDEVPGRLIVAAGGEFATLILLVREACFRALDKGSDIVTLDDLAAVYKARNANLKRDNPFTAIDWKSIVRANSTSHINTTSARRRHK